MTDPIADLLTRIRNAQAVGKSDVFLPYSKIKMRIAEILSHEGWIGKVEKIEPSKVALNKKSIKKNNRFDQIRLELKYNGKAPNIQSLKRISKPGRRIYVSKDNIPVVLNGYGMSIISTSRGLMTGKQARTDHVGGEIICEIF